MKRLPEPAVAATFLAIVILAGALAWQADKTSRLAQGLASLRSSLTETNAALAEIANAASSTAASTQATISELSRRETQLSSTPSSSDVLQHAVAAVTPAVVSIVESKEVPKLQVTYENPFGNDPNFQGFGIRVPVYQQVGTTTQQVSAGTGFFVTSNGYIVTNKHVVPDANATYTVLLADGVQKSGTVVWRSPNEDLAIVKIAGTGYATVPLGDSSTLKLGESVFAVGNALGQYNNSVSVGVVS